MSRGYDAVLRNWGGDRRYGYFALYGDIYDDILASVGHPFTDGKTIYTSPLVALADGIAYTRSGTRYKLE